MTLACRQLGIKFVVSIQGLISSISNYFNLGLSPKVIKGKTLRNIIFRDNIKNSQLNFAKRGQYEILTIQKSDNIIGRTDWDKSVVKKY